MPSSSKTAASPKFDFKRDLVALIPFLRAFARSICREGAKAEDLAQDALVKAWNARASFVPGTNLKAWLFTILRNEFYSEGRRSWRQMPWDEEAGTRIPAAAHEQQWHHELCGVADGLHSLPTDQREALVLIGAAGFSYTEASQICGVPEGTIKSRVARGRIALLAFMEGGRGRTTNNPRRQRRYPAATVRDRSARLPRNGLTAKGMAR